MAGSIIEVKNLSKSFIISHEGRERYTALRDVVTQKAKKIFSFPSSLRVTKQSHSKEEFWALKDVSFNIEQGDRVGIIGRNGAGKSTLLKILSRITEPTQGEIRIKGRVASLLEVGTGFHPELTGRENIFLNGAILGMSRAEIKRKFDEIVDFAEVEKFLDTPVKRYSSGMYVRLAFAVAAHLEPEILIVDEVLAVGDVQFQKKCLGKMNDVSKHGGRTVLFVSHNMTAIQSLCHKGIFLNRGFIKLADTIEKCVKEYLENGVQLSSKYYPEENGLKDSKSIIKVEFAALYKNDVGKELDIIQLEDSVKFYVKYLLEEQLKLNLSLVLWTRGGECVFNVCTEAKELNFGFYESVLSIPPNFLNDEVYVLELYFVQDTSKVILRIQEMIVFEVHEPERNAVWYDKWVGVIRPKLEFTIDKL